MEWDLRAGLRPPMVQRITDSLILGVFSLLYSGAVLVLRLVRRA